MKLKSIRLAIASSLISHQSIALDLNTIFAINSDNDALVAIDVSAQTTTTISNLNFYAQGEAVYNTASGRISLLDPSANPRTIYTYDINTSTSSNVNITNNDDKVQSLFGINTSQTFYVKTDAFDGESDASAKRFATVDADGSLTRIGGVMPNGSIYPQGTQLFDEERNRLLSVTNDQSKVLMEMDLDTGTTSTYNTTASTLVGFDLEGNVIGLITGTENPSILKINTTTGEEEVLALGVPDGGYDNFARGYVDLANSRIVMMLGGRAGVGFTGSGIATYSLTDGSLITSYQTTGQGRFVVTSLLKNVDTGKETLSDDINGELTTLIKTGEGELDVIGNSASETSIVILEGLLSQNGNAEDASAVVAEGATLGGSGTVGGIESSGTVAPGNSIGTLSVSGNVVLLDGSTMIIEVDSSGNNDKVIATGSVTVDGDLQISAASGDYNNLTYTFLSGSSLSGQFDSVSITGCSATPTVSYSSTEASFVIVSCNNNQSSNADSTISYLNDLNSGASGDLATVLNAINGLSGTAYSNAISQIDSDASSAMPAVISNAGTASVSSVSSRIGAISSSSSFTFNSLGDPLNTLNENDKKGLTQKGWWFDAFAGSTNADSQSNLGLNGYENDYHGTTIGYDQSNNDGGYKGVAATLSKGGISFDSSSGITDYDTYSVSPYYSFSGESGTTTIHGSVSFTDIETKRYLQFGAINRTASSSYSAISYGLGVDHQLKTKVVNDSFHTTILGAGINRLIVDGYSETGADSLNLNVDKFSQDSLNLRLAHRINWERQSETSLHKPFIDFGLSYEHRFGSENSSQALSGQSKWTTRVAEDSEMSAVIGAGYLVIDGDSQVSMGLKYKEAETFSDVLGSIQYKKSF